jgi:hypothetical protein
MKLLKISALVLFLSSFSTVAFSVEKKDCSTIDNSTVVGNIKWIKCKRSGESVGSNVKSGGKSLLEKIKGIRLKNPLKSKSE